MFTTAVASFTTGLGVTILNAIIETADDLDTVYAGRVEKKRA